MTDAGVFLVGERVEMIQAGRGVWVGSKGWVRAPVPEQSPDDVNVAWEEGGHVSEVVVPAAAVAHALVAERAAGPVGEAAPGARPIAGGEVRSPWLVELARQSAENFAGHTGWVAWPTAEGYWWFSLRSEGGEWSRPVVVACYRGAVMAVGSAARVTRAEVEASGDVVGYRWAALVEPTAPGLPTRRGRE